MKGAPPLIICKDQHTVLQLEMPTYNMTMNDKIIIFIIYVHVIVHANHMFPKCIAYSNFKYI